MLISLLSLPTLLLAEHVYTPVCSLDTFIIVNLSVTLNTSPFPVVVLTLSLINTLPLNVHTIVGNGIPVASQVVVMLFPSVVILSVIMMLVISG